ncbi:MAG: bestrophin family protein [Acidobacteriaceae bacterium]
MVVQDYPYWPRILGQTWRTLLTVFVVSLVVVFLDRHHQALLKQISVPDMTVTVLGAALSILLVFRTNSAYARWWEARTLWGALVNSSRSLARQAVSLTEQSADGPSATSGTTSGRTSGATSGATSGQTFARTLVYRQIAFAHAMRCALRRQNVLAEIQPFLDEPTISVLEKQVNIPAALLQMMGDEVAEAANTGLLTDLRLQRMDGTLTDLTNILGGCERIKNTPLPRQYDFYPELFIKFYCIVLPIIIVDDVKLFTPVVTLLVSFVFLVLNRIGKNLEDPFENRPYDVQLTALSRTIEINLRQALGETELPPAVQPVHGVLW